MNKRFYIFLSLICMFYRSTILIKLKNVISSIRNYYIESNLFAKIRFSGIFFCFKKNSSEKASHKYYLLRLFIITQFNLTIIILS